MRWHLIALLFLMSGCASTPMSTSQSDLRQQVVATETAFAQTMARRDFAAFTTFLADDTLFFNGDQPVRGKQRVAAEWKAFYDKPEPPFSWEPKVVEVLDGGTLALSSGPVRNPQGKIVAAFTSIWQLQDGKWKVIFDKGSRHCG